MKGAPVQEAGVYSTYTVYSADTVFCTDTVYSTYTVYSTDTVFSTDTVYSTHTFYSADTESQRFSTDTGSCIFSEFVDESYLLLLFTETWRASTVKTLTTLYMGQIDGMVFLCIILEQ